MNLLFLTFLFPLLGYLILAFGRQRLSENLSAYVGVGSVGLGALAALWAGVDFIQHPPANGAYTQVLWTWMQVGGFAPQLAVRLDGLSLVMLGVITGVGFLIHLFASWYMRGEEGYERFFSYMNLFVASMLFLVLADDLLFLYLGWEGVGLCSYLLIGFYYKDAANGLAARKAFVITRVGDTLMLIGLFILFHQLGSLNIQTILALAPQKWQQGDFMVTAAALLLLGGAVGKSAQLPLQTWLPDAMAGPTPVSALIHAATMVTAGVYLIARTHVLFQLAPTAQELVGLVGAATLLIAGFCALVQTDIKRVLAYSTMSQIGYMFLALGAGAWSAAIFHLVTHAFFKALLFLAAGSVILACHHEQNIFKMGGLRKTLPLTFWTFLIGSSALAALPWVTAGFYSKDEILWLAYANGHVELALAGLAGALMTAVYTFRLVFVAFFGDAKTPAHAPHGADHSLPLLVLAILSVVGGFLHLPLNGVLPEALEPEAAGGLSKHGFEFISALISVGGIGLAAWLFLKPNALLQGLSASAAGQALRTWWLHAFGFDWLYDKLFVRPFLLLVHLNRRDLIDRTMNLIPKLVKLGHKSLSLTQSGRLRWYAASMLMGMLALVTAVILV